LPELTPLTPSRSQGLVDVLDRILDKGLVIAGDVRVKLANVELLTIQVRLLICSIDKAEQIGLTWWKTDPLLAGDPSAELVRRENEELRARLRALEERMAQLAPGTDATAGARAAAAQPAAE
jgi:hypothetical protein